MAARLALIRKIHGYVGLFIAPSVVFFALTGALQLYGLHETRGAYHPPAILEKLGNLHKDQRFGLSEHEAGPADHDHATTGAEDGDHDHDAKAPSRAPGESARGLVKGGAKAEEATPFRETALKALFLVVATGLTLSTLLGVWMALLPHRRNALAISLLIAGVVLPAALALI
jgi:hypothetical protein